MNPDAKISKISIYTKKYEACMEPTFQNPLLRNFFKCQTQTRESLKLAPDLKDMRIIGSLCLNLPHLEKFWVLNSNEARV